MTPQTTTADYDDPSRRYSYRSELIERLRGGDGSLECGRVTLRTATSFGFCWGVDRAVSMVRDAIAEHPDERIWLLDQMIHNPRVNADFKAMGVRFLRGPFSDPDGGDLRADDVVIIPAFSAKVEDEERLKQLGCTIVDTTCPWVVRPHRRAVRYVNDGYTTVIHGLVRHEETAASCSLIASRGGHFLVVADQVETARLCAAIRGELGAAELLASLPEEACSPDFDPAVHLALVGTINQTTMLASETRLIEDMIRSAVVVRDGEAAAVDAFRELNTICKATQDNQDAVVSMAESAGLDLMVVVGGYDSSNTRNLTRAADGRFPSYHVIGPEAVDVGSIRHRCPVTGKPLVTHDWLPAGDVTVGFTAGASTPDTLLGATIQAVLEAAQVPLEAALRP
ncbi:MAG: 4-hydroxy-3-methylbut-2-enyl diphosphate reductase [Planctomycetota bacterium]|nr:MAG: 4-hydroxy-3-methylbut-2-enyl diphosphate reductase [Planctomycetota bacterium]